MAERGDGIIARWSRRKRGQEPPGDAAPDDATTPAPAETEAGAAVEPAEAEVAAQLPDIESLDEHADFTVFLKKGVPEELRKRALRRLWRLNPVFANLDGLNDYDEDFTVVVNLLEGLKTAYQVGKGMPDPAEPAGPGAGERDAGGAEAGPAPAGGESTVASNDEPLVESEESESQQVPAAGMMPAADQGAESPQREDTASGERPARARSGRSAAERRWGRPES